MFLNILKDKYLRFIGALSLLILFLTGLIFYFKFGQTTTPLIIHFEIGKGIDFLGGQSKVFGILFSSLIMILINFFLADFLYFRERFLSYIFGFASLTIAILILIVISVIISIN